MATLEGVIAYICKNYPLPDELSKARLTKLVYLADWESCIKAGKQITAINWYFHNFGPYVDDVINEAKSSRVLRVKQTENMYGDKKELIYLVEKAKIPELSDGEKEVIKSVINDTKRLYWNDFIKHVYETYPISTSERYTQLNLVGLAKSYKQKEKRG